MVPVVAKAQLKLSKPRFIPSPATNAVSPGLCKEREFWNELFILFLWIQLLSVWETKELG